MLELHRGDIFYIERFDTTGSEQHSGRPGIIVSNEKNNQFSATVEVVYLTSKPKENLPTHVIIDSTGIKSIALCEQITSIDKSKIGAYKCTVTADEMRKVDLAMMESLGLRYIQSAAGGKDMLPLDARQLRFELSELQEKNDKLQQELIRAQTAGDIYKRFYEDYISIRHDHGGSA